MRALTYALAALFLSSCATAAVVPAQTEQIKQGKSTLDSVQERVADIENRQKERLESLCLESQVSGFDC